MSWSAYQVVFKLSSPIHIGCGKIGNLQRTRSYVIGRVFWGALTMRLTRNKISNSPAIDSEEYKKVGNEVHSHLAYTYFYPATKSNGTIKVEWPWQQENYFRYRFLSSYTSTALSYRQHSASPGMLHEVEFLSPKTINTGEQVFLLGYVFEHKDCKLQWKEACERLQFGGERGYGWGDVELINNEKLTGVEIFQGKIELTLTEDRPIISLTSKEAKKHLLSHTCANSITATGEVEPLVGREWRSYNSQNRYIGQHIEYNGIYFSPGSEVDEEKKFEITDFGLWTEKK